MKMKWEQINRTKKKFSNKFADWLCKFVVIANKLDSTLFTNQRLAVVPLHAPSLSLTTELNAEKQKGEVAVNW